MPTRKSAAPQGAKDGHVFAWEDDPETAATAKPIERPVPDIKAPLAFRFEGKAIKPGAYPVNTEEFRYWVAAEALRRAADLWAPLLDSAQWHTGRLLPVILDAGEDFNAYYDRNGLSFFHGAYGPGMVYSGESPDILCHELGHAVLDAIKPELWGAASHEAAAFHESFGDISSILSALQLDGFRDAVLNETQGRLYRNSRLSRLAEQLGNAIRAEFPDSVDRDSLRNAVNSFSYQDPISLPGTAPASQLSSEAHSFSRVFTGAFFEAFVATLMVQARKAKSPTSEDLHAHSHDAVKIIGDAVKQARVVPNFFAQVAAEMITASKAVNPKYPAVMRAVFARRNILSLPSASNVQEMQTSAVRGAAAPFTAALGSLALSGAEYGLTGPLLVEASSQPWSFVATASVSAYRSQDPTSSVIAARAFANDLFRRGRVDSEGEHKEVFYHPRAFKTHTLRKVGSAFKLERTLFDCGLRHW